MPKCNFGTRGRVARRGKRRFPSRAEVQLRHEGGNSWWKRRRQRADHQPDARHAQEDLQSRARQMAAEGGPAQRALFPPRSRMRGVGRGGHGGLPGGHPRGRHDPGARAHELPPPPRRRPRRRRRLCPRRVRFTPAGRRGRDRSWRSRESSCRAGSSCRGACGRGRGGRGRIRSRRDCSERWARRAGRRGR